MCVRRSDACVVYPFIHDIIQLPARKQFVESRKSQADHKGAGNAFIQYLSASVRLA